MAQVGPELIPIALVVGGGSVLAAGFTVLTGRRRIRSARQYVLQIRSDVRDAYVTVDARWGELINDVVVARGALADDDGYALHVENQRQQATDAIQAATSLYVQAETDHDPEVRDSIEHLNQAAAWWQSVGGAVGEAVTVVDSLAALVAEIDAARDRCQGLLDIDDRMAAAQQAVGHAAAEGFWVAELEEALRRSRSDHAFGTQALEARQLWDANESLRRVDETVGRVDAKARGLAHQRGSLLARHAELAETLDGSAATVARISDVLGSLRSDFARSVWEGIDSAPAVAADAVAAARSALDRAATSITMEAQQFDVADQALVDAVAHLQMLDRVDTDVAQVRHDVDAAAAEYPAAHTEAARSLDEARQFTHRFAGDVNPAHRPSLDRAAAILAEAEAMAASRRADPFIAVQRLREVDSMTDAILYAARSEKQQLDAHRSRAASIIRDASRSVRRAHAASGFGVFGWSARVKQQLATADIALAEANGIIASDPGRAEYLAVEADQIAHQILVEHRRRQRNSG